MTTIRQTKVKAEEMVSDFLHVTSHQLLTPLTISQWYAQLLQSKLLQEGNENYNELIKEIQAANTRMREIVTLMLDTSRIESKTYRIKNNRVRLRKLIQEKLQHFENEFSDFDVETGINNLAHSDPVIYSDKDILGRVFELLIHNSLKYNRSKPRSVRVGFRLTPAGRLLVTFKDNGIGIPESDQKRIFTRFFRAGNASTLEPEGNGLSLYYAKRSLKLLGSEIWYRSSSDGTVFTIKL